MREGTTNEAESDDSSVRKVFLYYLPIVDSWTLVIGEDENTFTYVLAIDDVQDTARKHFDAGTGNDIRCWFSDKSIYLI